MSSLSMKSLLGVEDDVGECDDRTITDMKEHNLLIRLHCYFPFH